MQQISRKSSLVYCIFGIAARSTEDSQKLATYLQNKNTSCNCLLYLKEHLWLG